MRRTTITLLAAMAVLTACFAAPAFASDMDPAIPSLSNDMVTRLNGGEVILDVVPGQVPVGEAMGVVQATPVAVMEVISNFDQYVNFMEDISLSEVLGTETEAGVEYTLCHGITDTPWPMDDREWVIRATGGATQVDGVDVYVSTWTYVASFEREGGSPIVGNIVDTVGYWLAIPWGADGNQTLLRYKLRVDLGTWLPDFLLEWSTENFLPEKINAIRRQVAAVGG